MGRGSTPPPLLDHQIHVLCSYRAQLAVIPHTAQNCLPDTCSSIQGPHVLFQRSLTAAGLQLSVLVQLGRILVHDACALRLNRKPYTMIHVGTENHLRYAKQNHHNGDSRQCCQRQPLPAGPTQGAEYHATQHQAGNHDGCSPIGQ